MSLPPLHFLERREIGIGIIERHDEPERDLPSFLVIEEAATPCIRQRPALGVDHSSGFMFLRRNLPQFLDSKPKYLRPAVLAQAEKLGKPFRQMSPSPFGEEGIARVELHARL